MTDTLSRFIRGNITWIVSMVAVAAIAWFRVGVVEKSLAGHCESAATTYLRADVAGEQNKRIDDRLARIEKSVERIENAVLKPRP